MNLTLQQRIEAYQRAFPKFQPLYLANEKRIEGLWIMGNDYRVKSGYYGGYPAGYLPRVMSMFPDAKRILHLFSGCVEKTDDRFITFDINPERKPDICGDAERLSEYLGITGTFEYDKASGCLFCRICGKEYRRGCRHGDVFDLILADPPYSVEDCEHYGTPMVSRSKVIKECVRVLVPGGVMVWLDQVFPMFRKDELDLIGTIYARADLPEGLEHVGEIGMVKSTNHRVRAVFMFQRVEHGCA